VKRTRAAVIRRRRLAVTVTVATVLLTTGVVLASELPASSHANHHGAASSPSTTTTTSPSDDASAAQASLVRTLKRFIATRHGSIAVAVYDGVDRRLLVVHPSLRGRTASIVKVDILETLLHRTGGHLTEDERETARSMIENSDNDSATDLWNRDGGAAGVRAYNHLVGLHHTAPNVDWGDTTTSAADQVTLLRELLHPSSVLTDHSRRFARSLMRNVEADQRWGISAGVPSGAIIGIKNGWLPVSEDHDRWAVNSIGWVRGKGKAYEIAVITQHDPTEEYGIASIEHIAREVWGHVSARPSG